MMFENEDTNSSGFPSTNNSTPITNTTSLPADVMQHNEKSQSPQSAAARILSAFGDVRELNGEKYLRIVMGCVEIKRNTMEVLDKALTDDGRNLKILINERLYSYGDGLDRLMKEMPRDLYVVTEFAGIDVKAIKQSVERTRGRALPKRIIINGGQQVIAVGSNNNNNE